MKLIVTDMDGTLLNSKREVSAKNVQALLLAQERGIEIAIATGRNYANALAVCQNVGLQPHIISNHGGFIYTKDGKKIMGVGIAKEDVKYALTWLRNNEYFYTVCTDEHAFVRADSEQILSHEFKTAKNRVVGITAERAQASIEYLCRPAMGRTLVNGVEEIFRHDQTFGSIIAITFDQDKLQAGRAYFKDYHGLTMTVAGNNIFEMIHTSVSKGNALQMLTNYLKISMQDVMAIGDNYNDISMLEQVGISVAVGNAEEEVKKICKYVSLSNDQDGVAYIVNQLINGLCNGER